MAPRRPVVLDASALLDAAEAGRPERADALRDVQARHPCRAPALLAYELGNVIHRKHPDAFGAPHQREALLEVLLDGVDLVPSDPTSRARCAALVSDHGLTFYDAAYLDLAAPDAVLVSQDRRLVHAAREKGGRAMTLEEAGRAAREGRL